MERGHHMRADYNRAVRHVQHIKRKNIYRCHGNMENNDAIELISKEQGEMVLRNVLRRIREMQEGNKNHDSLNSC